MGVAGVLKANDEGLAAVHESIERELQALPSVRKVKARVCLMSLPAAMPPQDEASPGASGAHSAEPQTYTSEKSGLDQLSDAFAGTLNGLNTPPAQLSSRVVRKGIAHETDPIGGSIKHFDKFDKQLENSANGKVIGKSTKPQLGLELVLASRAFAGPRQYPPRRFAAYGIVVFPSLAAPADRARYEMICNAYVAELTFYGEVAAPLEKQMVTVWPVENDREASQINEMPRSDELCKTAVKDYSIRSALEAIDAARRSHGLLMGQGPFLLAWSPSTQMGRRDALVLVSNLSDVTTLQQAKEIFRRWRRDILDKPSLWRRGWNLRTVRLDIQLWSDEYGTEILKIFGIEDK